MSVANKSAIETAGPGPGYQENPTHFVDFEPSPKRVRVTFAGENIADTTNALILYGPATCRSITFCAKMSLWSGSFRPTIPRTALSKATPTISR